MRTKEEKAFCVVGWIGFALLAILFFVGLLNVRAASGADIEFSVRHTISQGSTTKDVQVEAGREARIVYKELLFSAAKTDFSLYNGTKGSLDSLGVGLQGELTPAIKIWGLITYNRPDIGGKMIQTGSPGWEGPYYETNERAAPTHAPMTWAAYGNEFSSAWGARFGFDAEKKIYRSLSAFVSGGYSILTLDRTLTSYQPSGAVAWQWTIRERFGGPEAGIGLSWKF